MKTIGLLSGKGGVGKTTSAINLAAGLNHYGLKTVVADGNITTPNVGIYMGLPVTPVNLHNVLKGENKASEAIHNHDSGLQLLTGSLALQDMQGLKLSRMKELKKLDADYVILDGAAGLGKEVLNVIEHSDELIIVTNPELPAITDALKTIRLAEELGKSVLGVLLTRAKGDDLDISVRNVEALVEYPVLGVIPEETKMREALSQKDAIVHTHPDSHASQNYIKLAANISGRTYLAPLRKMTWAEKVWMIIRGS